MATSAPIPPAIRAAATWAWVDKLAVAWLGDELMVCVDSAVLCVLMVLELVLGVELVVVKIVGVVGVVKVVGVVAVVGIVVEVVGVVEVVVGLTESDVVVDEIVPGKVKVLEVKGVSKPVEESDTVEVPSSLSQPTGQLVLESWAWEPGIYRGSDKRATYATKGPQAVGLKASILPIHVSSSDHGDEGKPVQ